MLKQNKNKRSARKHLIANILAAASVAVHITEDKRVLGASKNEKSLPKCEKRFYEATKNIFSANPSQFQSQTRMPLSTFQELCSFCTTNNILKSSKKISMEQKLLVFLKMLALDNANRDAAFDFGLSGSTISRYLATHAFLRLLLTLHSIFSEVLLALVNLKSDFIRTFESETSVNPAILKKPKFFPYFQGCVGALDGTHILVTPPKTNPGSFRNRKGDLSQNALAVCDFSLRFTYILAGWEGSVNDQFVLNQAHLHDGFGAPEGRYYIADAGYSCTSEIIVPY
jgi:DDE superfamily endonuclease